MFFPYPNAYQIEEMFANRDVPTTFHTYLDENVDVTVVGKDFHVGGQYKSPQAFHDQIFARLAVSLKEETIRVEVLRVIGGGESAWAAVESVATATSKYDETYHVELVDLVRFNSQGKIVQLKEFFDSGHIQKQVKQREEETKKVK